MAKGGKAGSLTLRTPMHIVKYRQKRRASLRLGIPGKCSTCNIDDDGIGGHAGDGETSMQDMSLSLLNMSLDDETLDALGLTH